MTYLEHAHALRNSVDVHYNCCQSVLVPFAKEMGLTEQQAYAMGAHFGSGMRHGATCGAFAGAMMALGMLGRDEKQATALIRQFKADHGDTTCTVLLKASHDRGEVRKDHCDALVYELVATLEKIING